MEKDVFLQNATSGYFKIPILYLGIVEILRRTEAVE
jgi:hypothetical protein